jgi:predicted CXXCH cytochrome family protein
VLSIIWLWAGILPWPVRNLERRMKKLTGRWFRICFLLVAITPVNFSFAMYALNDTQHLGTADCTVCHVAGNSVTVDQAGLLTNTQENLCGGACHQSSVPASHPSGFVATSTPLPDYPLTSQGNFTCSTCHFPHGTSSTTTTTTTTSTGKKTTNPNSPKYSASATTSTNVAYLRGTVKGSDLCYACHALTFFSSMLDGGNSLMVGHLSSKPTINTLPLDLYSRQCLDCHAPTGEMEIATGIDQNGTVIHTTSSVNHTIGISYQQSYNSGGYRPQQNLATPIMLPSGALSCVSCHFAYVKQHGKLAINNNQSNLCRECHDK